MRAATANVLGNGSEELEQAIFTDELLANSLDQARTLMMQQWRNLLMKWRPGWKN